MPFHHVTLANGLTVIGETSPSARSVAVGFFVRTGSRDEDDPAVSGVSHFLEHMVFKGTERRSALDVNREFDAIGANYNAFTSEEHTVFYAALLPEYLPRGFAVLADILRPALREADFDTEKKVIIEEIGMYDDQPQWCAYDHARKAFFGAHALGNSVLGSVASVGGLTRDQMAGYFAKRYVAPNIVVAAAGAFDFAQLAELAAKHCAAWPGGAAPRSGVTPVRQNPGVQAMRRESVQQEQVLLLSPAPAVEDPLRYAADVLATVLGDASGSRLYWDLVDPGLADSADMGYHDYQGAGAFLTSFSSDPENVAENLEKTAAILAEAQKRGVTEAELRTAKNKVLSRIVRAGERPMGRMQALGMVWSYFGEYRTVDDDLRAFEAVDLTQTRTVLERYPLTSPSIFALGPLESIANPTFPC